MQDAGRRTQNRRLRRCCLLTVLLVAATFGCGRPRPTPQPPVSTGPPSQSSPNASTTTAPKTPDAARPELSLEVDPARIERGESALLTWESRNASSVNIEPGIGRVDSSGRIRFFPDLTSRYEVTATGPGGSVTQSITVEVVDPGADARTKDLTEPSLLSRFQEGVLPVFFAFDSAELDAEARRTLEANAEWLLHSEHLPVHLVIEGHCDERGSDEYNLALGDRRAQVVYRFLAKAGIDAERLVAVSLGEERPFDRGGHETDFALNRRAHFVLIEEAALQQQRRP